METLNYNPDVLSCLANLSNDEVFTPPNLVNDILDLLPVELWSNPEAKFLDPVCKSGVFLREIAKRLIKGLETQIPDQQERVNHIFGTQLYGIAITELTSLLSRRSVYCSKLANGEYSICETFSNEQGNIHFERIQHTWQGAMCAFCGASQEVYERGEEFESYAYNFIHTNNPEKIFNMKFDVIVGNPPYQLSDGGSGTGISAKPIYQQFVKQAIKLNPLYLVFIIPSRWFAGGKGLDDFRNDFLNDKRLKYLVDFPKSRDCFPGVDVAGGVCYFLWDINHNGNCQVTSVINNSKITKLRILNEFDVFVRDNTGIDIINKIRELNSNNYSKFVFARNPFGFVSSERGSNKKSKDSIKLISSAGIGFVNRENVTRNASLINYYKVMIGKVNPDRGGVNNASDGKMNVITKVRLIKPNEVFTETYLLLGCFKTEKEAIRCCKFFSTKFVRFLISLTLSSMNITRDNFQFVPLESMDIDWDDPMFYLKYNLNESEVQYIETSIRLMGFSLSENIDE